MDPGYGTFGSAADATRTYHAQEQYKDNALQRPTDVGSFQFPSMSGQTLGAEQFTHSNMTPFNGGKVRGHVYKDGMAESVLDNMVGTGSQIIQKRERAPLFRPEENVNWTYGMPTQTDFMQSRVNPSLRNNNVKPFESMQVAPGLNQGYGNQGSNGYNSGMESRELWMPKTINEQRVLTNPKIEYELANHEGPAYSFIRNAPTVETQGRVEKQRPDTVYENTPDRWFTTTGALKGPMAHAAQETGIIRREDGAVDYVGPASDSKALYAPQNFEPAKRHEAIEGMVNAGHAVGRGDHGGLENHHQSYVSYENHRSTTRPTDSFGSGFSAAIGAVVAPIMDMMRPTRKAETAQNGRMYGDLGSSVPQGYVVNPLDVAPTTVKETTLYAPAFHVNQPNGGSAYLNNQQRPDATQRDSTSTEYFQSAGGSATTYGATNYFAAYQQRNNDIKSQTIYNRTAGGGTQLFNPSMNVTNLRSDVDRFDGRVNPAFSTAGAVPPTSQLLGASHGKRQIAETTQDHRLDPGLLDAFRANPYTQSLSSVA